VVLTALGAPPILLRNTAGGDNHWLGLRLTGRKSNRDAIGAGVHIVTGSGEQWNHVTTAVGYAGSSEQAVHFGLGKESRVSRIEISWPSGAVQRLEDVAADRYINVTEP
jgi:hypothetical protein